MGAIERFEDLIAWQKARTLTSAIYRATGGSRFAQDYGLRNQIQRAAVSVMSNIAEGFERNKPTELHQYLCIAKSSCAEVRSQLYVASDVGYIDEGHFQALLSHGEEAGRIIGGLRASVERNI